MDLPSSFAFSMRGGIPTVTCDRCGAEARKAVFLAGDEVELEDWARVHECGVQPAAG